MDDDFAPLGAAENSSSDEASRRARSRQKKADAWKPVTPAPDDAPPPPSTHPKRGRRSTQWAYRDAQGSLMMYVCRFDKEAGEKDILPLTFCKRGDLREWRWKGLLAPRPLYNLNQLYARRNAPVLIVEGEKAADAAAELFPDFVVMTWPNGSNAAAKSDWGPLAKRTVTLWPDADEPGREAMKDVFHCLKGVAVASVCLVEPPDGVKKGWDAADALDDIKASTRERDAVLSLVVNAADYVMTDETGTSKTNSNQGADNPKRNGFTSYQNAIGDIDLWHTPTKEPWATVPTNEGFTNYRIDGPDFPVWIDYACVEKGLGVPSREILTKLIAELRARAVHEGPEHRVYLRVAGQLGDAVYIDLGGDDGKAIELRPDGWKVISHPPVKFRRVMSMQPLPEPDPEGSVDELWSWVNCQSDDDRMMGMGFIQSAMMPKGPYPLLVLSGPPGASKSFTSKVIRSLIDPSAIPLSGAPNKPGDFTSVLENSRLLVFDNIAKIPQWLSDLLCMVATGSGIRQRQLHTNTGEVLIEGGRPAILNGIGDLTTRPDLANRCVIVNLEPVPQRRAEHLKTCDGEALWTTFHHAAPGILGGLCDVFCAAMKFYNEEAVLPEGNPRMVDFAIWGNAVGKAMGWEPGAFDAAYKANRSMADEIALEDSFLWKHLEKIFPTGEEKWSGSATELKVKILFVIENIDQRKKFDSVQVSTIGKELSRIRMILNQKGWKVFSLPSRKHSRTWHIIPPRSEG